MNLIRGMLGLLLLGLLGACDPQHRRQCEWYLVPDLDRPVDGDGSVIPVCARNFVTNKQDCRLEADLEYAKSVYNRKFRYSDLRVKNVGIPRRVDHVAFCEG